MAKGTTTKQRDLGPLYDKLAPEDKVRGVFRTPMYGVGRIPHMTVDYPAPVTPPNTLGLQHANKGGGNRRKGK